MSPDLALKIAAIGRVIDPARTAPLYAPLHAHQPGNAVTVLRDIRYGAHARHRLDVFAPREPTGAVLIFVHGGGFTGGDKSIPGSPFYDNIPLWAARNGLVGVNMTYRLAPDHPWPAGAEDVAAAVRWTRDHIAAHGGDPAKLFLFGHSAGATHAATYAAMPRFHGEGGLRLAGLILTSGVYDMSDFPPNENFNSYFGFDPSLHAARSPLANLRELGVPSLIARAELEPPPFVTQYNKLVAALAKAPGGRPRTCVLAQHSHLSLGYAIGTDDTALSDVILEFVKAVSEGSSGSG